MIRSTLPILILSSLVLTLGLTAKEPTHYVVGGKTVERKVLKSQYNSARQRYAVDPTTRQVKSASELQAVQLSGKIIKQNGRRALFQKSDGGTVVVDLKTGTTPEADKNITLTVKRRKSKIRQRMQDGSMKRLLYYQDVTLTLHEFVSAINRNVQFDGVYLNKQTRAQRLDYHARPKSQFKPGRKVEMNRSKKK